jgi:erythritol transport system permease protein
MNKTRVVDFLSDNALIIIIVLLFGLGTVASDKFITVSNMQNLLYGMTVYGFLALGQSLVMLVSELNLTLGALVCFAPTMGMWITQQVFLAKGVKILQGGQYIVDGLGLYVVFTLLTGALVGLFIGLIITKFNVSSMVATLGLMYVIGGCVFFLFRGYALYLNNLQGSNWLGTAKIFYIPVSFILLILVGIMFILIIKHTKFGPYLYATGGNEKAAIYAGINTKRWKVVVFSISGLLASIAALIYSSRLESIEPTQGTGYQMFALAISVVGGVSMEGGRGTLTGTLLASAIVALVFNVMSMIGLYSWYQTMFIGAIILFAAVQQAYNRKSLV